MATVQNVYWNPTIYDNNTALPLDVANKCIKLMLGTAVVAKRDFANFTASRMVAKVAYVNPRTAINYMKVRTGRDNTNPVINIDFVIIYHYLNHRNAWAVSVGFSPSTVPDVSPLNPGTGNGSNEYVTLATSIADQVHADLLSFTPGNGLAYIYDDVDYADPTGSVAARRRVTPIGELGWVFQNNAYVRTRFSFSQKIESVPITADNVRIPPGYYRPGDLQVSTTKVQTL